jgi:phosphatidylethanolamine/phosphatidyl-N-methylethanolamine N-methyltransferase
MFLDIMIKKSPIRENLTFIKRWMRNPLQMGSILPSSAALSVLMARSALERLSDDDVVLEIGAGTGRFTRALLDAGLSSDRLISMELDKKLHGFLEHQFPRVNIIHGNAVFLTDLLPKSVIGRVGVIVSGIPMLSISSVVQDQIMRACLDVLGQTGCFLQMTYSPFSSIPLERYGIKKEHVGRAWSNFPPANVWCYTRQGGE